MDPVATVGMLLKHYRRSFAEELGIEAESNTPSALFCLLVSALLFSARIGHRIALASARILMERGWTTAKKMAATRWEQRVRALDDGGYVRFDEHTSTLLGDSAQMLLDRYGGDLRRLREAAGLDPAVERRLLKEFKGVGEVGADIFFREAQLADPALAPIPVVVMSAQDCGDVEAHAKLQKPFEVEDLLRAISRASPAEP